MADAFFDPLPSGPIRLSKSYLGRMQDAVEQSSRTTPSPYPGAGGADSLGSWSDFQPEEMLVVAITQTPTGGYSGYSWAEKRPIQDGEFADLEIPRLGWNGSDGENQRLQPAFPLNPSSSFAVDDIVILLRGYTNVNSVSIADQDPEVDLGSLPVYKPGQEYLILPGGGSGSSAIAHVVGQPRVLDARRWYNARLSITDATTHVRSDGTEIWLLQVKDAELATDGAGYYIAVRRSFTMTVDGETRPVYETDQRIRVIDEACNDDTGGIDRLVEGAFGGNLEAGSGFESEGGDHFVSEGGDDFILET